MKNARNVRSSALTLLVLAALLPTNALGAQYTISVQAGWNLIANQLNYAGLNPGGNTLNNIMPWLPCDCSLAKYDNASTSWITTCYYTNCGWANGLITLNPGDGAWLNATCPFLLTFSGTPGPIVPVTIPLGSLYFLSAQIPASGTWANIVDTPVPPNNTQVYAWNNVGLSYNIFTYGTPKHPGVWSPSEPFAPVGEPVWICPGGGCGNPPIPPTLSCTNPCLCCLTITNQSVNCLSNMTYQTYQWQFCVTNCSQDIFEYLDIPDLPAGVTLSENIVTLWPVLNPGQGTCLTLYITNTIPDLASLCFTIWAHNTNLVQCCSISNCITLPSCCMSLSDESLVPLPGTGCYNYYFTIQNTSPFPTEYLMLVQNPPSPPAPACVSFSPDIFWMSPPLLPWQSVNESTKVCIAPGCKGPFCFFLGATDENPCTNQCCSIWRCLPVVSNAPVSFVTGFDGATFAAGTITVPLALDTTYVEPSLVRVYVGTNIIYSATSNVTTSTVLSVTWGNVVAGTYTLLAEVIDSLGGDWFSEPATVYVLQNQISGKAPMLTSVKYVDNALSFSVATTADVTYQVESTASLSLPQWTVLQSIVGDGSTITVTNAATAARQGYYRVRLGK